ncbi:hypothetical protein PIROE2DRAFT_9250 [Piromyces sp. E2]|nr:hypothetical protein PIROE2DRAFT_9250 [Piromyces sp. E2]|eukprot:OUM64085.1 hypothetical protein PIROE2DRAFT_9250 [Piromyces sp. E2]
MNTTINFDSNTLILNKKLNIVNITKEIVSIIKNNNNNYCLDTFLKTNKINVSFINDNQFDLLVFAIENYSSISVIKYLINFYHDVNYVFSPAYSTVTGYYSYNNEQYIRYLRYYEMKVPLFSAIAIKAFDIADLLIQHHADINYTIEREGKHINIINYLCSIGPNYIDEKTLKYILSKGFHAKNLTPEVLQDLFSLDHHWESGIEKNKIPLNEKHYNIIIEHSHCIDILQFLFCIDEQKAKIYLGQKVHYDLLYHAIKTDKPETCIKQIISMYNKYKYKDTIGSFEDLILNLCEHGQGGIVKLIFDIVFSHPEYGIARSSINFKKIISKFSKCMYYYYDHGIGVIKALIEAFLQVKFETNDFHNMDLSLLSKFKGSYLTLALHMVMKTENIDLLKIFYPKFISKFPFFNINSCDINKNYPIITAYYDDGKIFKYIFELGANYEISKKYNSLSLFTFAVDTDRYLQAKCLLQKDIIINELDILSSCNLLLYAIFNNDLQQVKSIVPHRNKKRKLSTGDEKDTSISNYFTPIKDLESLRMIRNNCGFTPLILSYILKNEEIFEYLLEHVNINELDDRDNRCSILFYAVLREDIPIIRRLVHMGADVNFQKWIYPNWFLLDIVLLFLHNKEIYDILLESPLIQLNNTNLCGKTHVMSVLKSDRITEKEKETVLLRLIEKGYDVNTTNSKNGKTALHYAIQNKSISLVKILVEYGANVNINDEELNYSPLCTAYSSPEIFQYLVEQGADVNNIGGKSPFHLAYEYGSLKSVKLLLERNVDLNSEVEIQHDNYYSGRREKYRDDEQKMILEYLFKKYPQYITGSIIRDIIYNDRIDVIKILFKCQPDKINIRDHFGDTPLVHTIRYKKYDIMDYLLNCGADVRITYNDDIDQMIKNYSDGSYIRKKLKNFYCSNINYVYKYAFDDYKFKLDTYKS